MSRFFVDINQVSDDSIVITSKEDIKHIKKVLRMKIGDEIEVSDSEKWEYICSLESIDDSIIETRILDKQKFAREPNINIDLFQGIPKQGKMEIIIQKNVELGVRNIIPVFMDRTVVSGKDKFDKKLERYNTIAHEAAKQCRRGRLSYVTESKKFKDMLNTLSEYDLIVFPYENEDDYTIKKLLKNLEEKPKNIAVIIGPEGGFSDTEAKVLEELNVISVSLGKTILRTETAGMAALSMIMYEYEL